MLSSWGIEFDPVDVQADPAALEELTRLGVPQVPAVAVGDRAAHGWNPSSYARLLGVRYEPPTRLAPAELARRLDTVLATAERLLPTFSTGQMAYEPPERDRTLRDLAYHVFRLSLAFIEAMESGTLPRAGLGETAPPDIADGLAIARYGARVRTRIQEWFHHATPEQFTRVVDVYYGPQSAHELLERTTWHAGQHLRQIYEIARRCAVTPPTPLPLDALKNLPLPDALW